MKIIRVLNLFFLLFFMVLLSSWVEGFAQEKQKDATVLSQERKAKKERVQAKTKFQTQEISFSKEKVVEIDSISESVGKGEVFFKKGKKSNKLIGEVNGTVPVIEGGKWCPFCMELIRIAPNLKVPLTFFTDNPYKQPKPFIVESVEFKAAVLDVPISSDATKFIVSGSKGATLKKEGRGFLLIEGEAYLWQIKEEPFVIRDEKFEATYKESCNTDAEIVDVSDGAFSVRGLIDMQNVGIFSVEGLLETRKREDLFCYGAKHTWIGTLTYGGYTFISDKDEPLQFMVDKDKGYVYVKGKGTVKMPDGKTVKLPLTK